MKRLDFDPFLSRLSQELIEYDAELAREKAWVEGRDPGVIGSVVALPSVDELVTTRTDVAPTGDNT